MRVVKEGDWQYQVIFNRLKDVDLTLLPNFPLFTEKISEGFNLSVLVDRFHPERFTSKSGVEVLLKTKPFSLEVLGDKLRYTTKTLLLKLFLLHPIEKYINIRYPIKYIDKEYQLEILSKKYPGNYVMINLE